VQISRRNSCTSACAYPHNDRFDRAGSAPAAQPEAGVARVDVLVSWNFKHIVNLRRIHGYNSVNLRRGYPTLEIRAPREVLSDE
jgi:hypothetical protein